MDSNEIAWAAFRTALISPLLTGEIPKGQREAYMQMVASEVRLFPNGKRAKVSVRTLWRWLRRMRQDGFQGIVKQPRSDRGKARRSTQARVVRAIELKREQPMRSDRVINQILKAEFGATLPSATLFRHLRIHGATRIRLGVAKEKVRCRWTRELPNALWQGDFEHGPFVLIDATVRQSWFACRTVRRQQPKADASKKLDQSAYIQSLLDSSEQKDKSKRRDGINFQSAMAHGRLTKGTLCQVVAKLLGRQGGLSGLSADEIASGLL